MTQRFKYVENNEFGLDVYFDRYKEHYYVAIPHTHTGWGSGTLERANNLALSEDAERCGQMNINDAYNVSGTYLVAIVDNYTDEQWELLEELLETLMFRDPYDEQLFHEIESESQMEAIKDMLPYDTDIEPSAVLESIHMLDLYFVEEEGENWYISEDDFKVALQHAIYYIA